MRFAVFFLLLALTLSYAEDFVAVNSVDGRDVLSGVYYANVKGLPVKFMPLPGSDAELFASKVGSDHDILLIQGDKPVSGFVEGALRSRNNTVDLYASANGGATNLDLARRSGATSFIVVDSAYSDSALSVLPYAALTKSYVLLSNKDNAAAIRDIVAGKKVIIYGYVDQTVRDELESMNPEYIGKGEDKYEDNIIIVGKAMDEFSISRVIITDGSYIEDSMAGPIPVLLSGRIVPSPTYNFVKEGVGDGSFQEVLLVGNDPAKSLVTPVYDMRGRINSEYLAQGMNKSFLITVKFAQVVPGLSSGALILDTFPLPAYKPKLNVSEVVYNTDDENVMITVDDVGDGAAFYDMEARVTVDGDDYAVFTSPEVRQIEREGSQGTEFPLDLSSVPEGDVAVTVTVRYGASKNSLEDFAYYQGPLTTISYVDASNVSVQNAKYDREQKLLMVTFRNRGAETAYSSSKVQLFVDGLLTNISSPSVRELEAGSIFVEEYPLELTEEDISANKEATVFLKYGARKGFLKKGDAVIVPLEEAGYPILYVGLIALVILIAGYYLYERNKKAGRK